MTKNDFMNAIQDTVDFEVTKKDLTQIVDAIGTVVVNTLKEDSDEKVVLPGLGTFKVKHVSERSGVAALAGGKAWTKPAHNEICFKISKNVKNI